MERSGESHKRQLFLIIGSIALVVGILLLTPSFWILAQRFGATLMIDNQLDELDAARSDWAARPFSRYRLVVENESYWGNCKQDVEIENEVVTAIFENTCGAPPPPTISDLFSNIVSTISRRECGPNGCACDGVISVEVVYHAQLGYPLSIRKYLKEDWTTTSWLLESQGCTLIGTILPEITVTLETLE